MTEPTDAELRALLPTKLLERDKPPKVQVWLTQKDAFAFARAVLAKWGPPSGAVNWVGLSSHHLLKQEPLGAEFEAVLDKHRSELYAEATTPQPTQAQAGAVPLTDEQITAAAKELAFCMDYPWGYMAPSGRDEMHRIAKSVIEAAGIKGGQNHKTHPVAPEAAAIGAELDPESIEQGEPL